MSNNESSYKFKPKKITVSKGHDILYNTGTLDKIFSTSLEKQPFFKNTTEELQRAGIEPDDKLLKGIDSNGLPIYLDKVNSYKYNSHGYRSPEFGPVDFLFAGCSTTFGTGVPEEAIWGSVMAKELNFSYANISKQGASAQWIVKNIFAYFDTYGHPETVCCLFPDLFRMSIATNNSQLVDARDNSKDDDLGRRGFSKVYEVHLNSGLSPKDSIEYSKKPHSITDVIPADAAVYASMQSILTLDQYCRTNGIKFAWSTWDTDALVFFDSIKDMYPNNYANLASLDLLLWGPNPDKKCGGEVYLGKESLMSNGAAVPTVECHAGLLSRYATNFYRGMDDVDDVYRAHPGIHQHAHIAESFMKSLASKN